MSEESAEQHSGPMTLWEIGCYGWRREPRRIFKPFAFIYEVLGAQYYVR